MAGNNDNLDKIKIIDNQEIAASGTYTSIPINCNDRKLIGNISIQVEVTGDGTASFTWTQSNSYDPKDGTGDFVAPSGGNEIETGFTKTSGSASNGKDFFNIPMYNSQWFKILCTETAGVNTLTVNAWLSMQ